MSYSLDTLEYAKLLELVSRHVQTPMGVGRLADLRPFQTRPNLDAALAALSETITINEEKQISWSFNGIEDPSNAIAILKIQNAALEPNLMIEIARVCTQALFARSTIQPEKETAPMLWQIIEPVPPTLLAVIQQINKQILPGGGIDDSASPELAKLRSEINAQKGRLTKSLESAMRAAGNAIQDEIVTVRNDRFVIPVKTDFRGKVTGVAHGFSSSGHTVYVEPLEAIEANNELQNLKGKEEREVARILFALTESLRGQLPGVEAAVEAVAELDFIKAKVEFARKFRAVVPEITDDETLDLVDARHPLLSESPTLAGGANAAFETPSEGKDTERNWPPANTGGPDWVVPNSFSLTHQNAVMIISGANAGGKTVVLKTAGLLSLMAISGLPVPAVAAKIPFYRSILADIGDHQSLSANLSTFSSHMSNIAGMIRECQPPSLVLLDEAGTGTDPEEGSALGVAIVDHFRQKGAQVIASTHYRGLKMYAANDESIINASVEFDEQSLEPTYKLLLGLAGASSGIEIARRFGVEQSVIDAARKNLDLSAQEAENYLKRLHTEIKIATDLRVALEEEREAVAISYGLLEVEAVKKEKVRKKEFESELANAMDEFDRKSKAFLQTLDDKALKNKLEKERQSRKAEMNRAITSKVQGLKSNVEMNPESGAIATGSKNPRPYKGEPAPASAGREILSVGSRVVTSFGNIGTVERLEREIAEVLVGGMRLREKIANLQLAEVPRSTVERPKPKITTGQSSLDVGHGTLDISAELNLIGKTTADAEYEIDRFLDEAYMASLPRVRIIHGFGTGALKNYVHHFLKNHQHVEKYGFAPSSQGGNGATIVEIKL